MQQLTVGMKIVHDGRAIELLYRVATFASAHGSRQVWKALLLFVEPQEVLELFEPHDTFSFIHSGGQT